MARPKFDAFELFRADCTGKAHLGGFDQLLETFLDQHDQLQIKRVDLIFGVFEIVLAKLKELEEDELKELEARLSPDELKELQAGLSPDEHVRLVKNSDPYN
jgi:hypothetical protein